MWIFKDTEIWISAATYEYSQKQSVMLTRGRFWFGWHVTEL